MESFESMPESLARVFGVDGMSKSFSRSICGGEQAITSSLLVWLVESLNGKGGFWGVGESSKLRGVARCFVAGLRGGGVKSRGCFRGGDSHIEDSVEENDLWWGDCRGVAKPTFQPYTRERDGDTSVETILTTYKS